MVNFQIQFRFAGNLKEIACIHMKIDISYGPDVNFYDKTGGNIIVYKKAIY